MCRPRQVPGCLAVFGMLARAGRFLRHPVHPGKNWDSLPSPAIGQDGLHRWFCVKLVEEWTMAALAP